MGKKHGMDWLSNPFVLALLGVVAVLWITVVQKIRMEYREIALEAAARHGMVSQVKLLLHDGVGVEGAYPGDLLHCGIVSGNPEVCNVLLNAGARVNVRDSTGTTELHEAVLEGRVAVVKVLLAHGADLNVRSSLCGTPLQAALDKHYLDIAKVLKQAGAKQ